MGASGHGGYPWLARLGEILGRTGPEVPKAILCKKLGESWLYEHSRLGSHGQGMQHAQLPFLQLRKSFDNIKKDAPLVFALHGDAAPHTETDSLMVVSLRSLTTKLSVSESQLLLFALPKSMIGKETLQPIWKVLCWSLEAMTKGRWPTKVCGNLPTYKVRSGGKPLMGYEKRATVTSLHVKQQMASSLMAG